MRAIVPMVMGSILVAGCSLYFEDTAPPRAEDLPCPGADCPGPYPPPPEPQPPEPQPPEPQPPGPTPMACDQPQVHLFGVYETRASSGASHPPGTATVDIERPGRHVVVLSAYEPTTWQVRAGADATIEAIHVIGYHQQRVVGAVGVPVVIESHDQDGASACGYSWPYNGGGCDTAALMAWATAQAGGLTSFHGCYQASHWTLGPGAATSDCNTAAGYQVDRLENACEDGGGDGWTATDFTTAVPYTGSCTGARFVRFSDTYGLWVGAALCGSADRYKLFLSPAPDHGYLEIADYGGHGQDHCELVDPGFAITNDDDITSGGCTTCDLGGLIDPIGVPLYARSRFGQPFERTLGRDWADLSTPWYACGVAIGSN